MHTKPAVEELSSWFGATVLFVGVALWGLQFTVGVFNGWGWALAIGGSWMILGTLLLFPDMRLYAGAESPAELLYQAEAERVGPSDD